jgi:hypothetical protein
MRINNYIRQQINEYALSEKIDHIVDSIHITDDFYPTNHNDRAAEIIFNGIKPLLKRKLKDAVREL